MWARRYPNIFSGLSASSPVNAWLLQAYLSDQDTSMAILANLIGTPSIVIVAPRQEWPAWVVWGTFAPVASVSRRTSPAGPRS
jgi:hypothetical protein